MMKKLTGLRRIFNYSHIYFPDFRDFEGILAGAVNSGQLKLVNTAAGMLLQAVSPLAPNVIPITPDTMVG